MCTSYMYMSHRYAVQYSVQNDDVKYTPTMGYHKKDLKSSAVG